MPNRKANPSKRGFASHPENINKNGRPKTGRSLNELLRSKGEGFDERIIDAMIEKASTGDVAAAKLLWDRAYGCAPQHIEMNQTSEENTEAVLKAWKLEWRLHDFFGTFSSSLRDDGAKKLAEWAGRDLREVQQILTDIFYAACQAVDARKIWGSEWAHDKVVVKEAA